MHRMTKQDIERHYFEMFCKSYPLPPGMIVYGDSPDVIVEGQRHIGIEMTNFFLEEGSLPQSEQAQRNLRDKVVSEAQRLFHASHGNGNRIEITFGFDKANPIRDQNKLIKAIVELAKGLQGRNTGEVRRDFYKAIPELSFVYLNTQEYDDARWRIVQVYTGQIMSRDRLLDIVKDKEKCAVQYKACDAYWLLVVVDFLDRAQDQEIQIDDFPLIQSEVFEKVIIYKTVFGHILEAK